MERVLIYLGHPAHFHLFKHIINILRNRGHEVRIVIKKKDILERLLMSSDMEYQSLLKERKSNKFKSCSFIKREFRLYRYLQSFDPDIMIGTSAEIAHIGKLMDIPSYIFNEDDWDVVPLFSMVAYPFASKLISPTGTRMGRWENKTIHYNSYHELAYLHPNHFQPSLHRIRSFHSSDRPYFILRLVKLSAHHDHGIRGINNSEAKKLISILTNYGNVYITSERKLDKELEAYRIIINPLDIHHALYFAKAFIGDSQTMAAESMVLGTPSLRFNDFVGRLSYLNQLENYYKLGYGFRTNQFFELCDRLKALLDRSDIEDQWEKKRKAMLSEKVNFADFIANSLL